MSALVLTARSDSRNERHARILVFQNGGKAGILTVEREHEEAVIRAIRQGTTALDCLANILAAYDANDSHGIMEEIERARAAIDKAESRQ